MNFTQSLDRYLTSEPENGFTEYCEKVLDGIPNGIYQEYQEWFDAPDGRCNDLLNVCHSKGIPIKEASVLIVHEVIG